MAQLGKEIASTRTDAEPSIGLALGGGGARGLAHIVVLEAFDELGLRPALIAGTSIGAIFGAGYASGLEAAAIRDHTLTLLSKPTQTVKQLFSGGGSFLDLWNRRPLSGSLMNAEALLEIVFPDGVARAFSDLALPLQVIATDFHRQEAYVMQEGPVLPAVAASMALPALFQPVAHQGRILVDGGLANPLPFDLIEPRVDLTVAIDVTGGPVSGADPKPPSAFEAIVASSQIMQNAIVREKLARHKPDMVIRPAVDRFKVLEFYKVRQILEAAAPLKDTLKQALDARLTAAP